MKKVAIIMGSDSDFEKMVPAIKQLKDFGIENEVHVMSAHRTPEKATAFAKAAAEDGYGVIIAAAGMAAHLAGVLAANTHLPVIGVPIKASFDGLDALLATVQMPSGIPVATVSVDGAKNAAILAAEMLSIENGELSEKIIQMKNKMAEEISHKDKAVFEKAKNI